MKQNIILNILIKIYKVLARWREPFLIFIKKFGIIYIEKIKGIKKMTYIINPSWVYWLTVLDGLKVAAVAIGVISLLVTVLLGIGFLIEDDTHLIPKLLKITIPIMIVCLLLGIFIPSQETMIMMKAAELATKENIQYTGQQLKELIDYIILAVKTMNG